MWPFNKKQEKAVEPEKKYTFDAPPNLKKECCFRCRYAYWDNWPENPWRLDSDEWEVNYWLKSKRLQFGHYMSNFTIECRKSHEDMETQYNGWCGEYEVREEGHPNLTEEKN